jgi:hypothetical protein
MIRNVLAMVLIGLAVFFMFRIWLISRDVEKRARPSEEWHRQHAPQYLDDDKR